MLSTLSTLSYEYRVKNNFFGLLAIIMANHFLIWLALGQIQWPGPSYFRLS